MKKNTNGNDRLSGVISNGKSAHLIKVTDLTPAGVMLLCEKAIPLANKYIIRFTLNGAVSKVELNDVPVKLHNMDIVTVDNKIAYKYDVLFSCNEHGRSETAEKFNQLLTSLM